MASAVTLNNFISYHQRNLIRMVESVCASVVARAEVEKETPKEYRIPTEFDNLIGLAGGRGCGKTTMLYHTALALSRKTYDEAEGKMPSDKKKFFVLRPVTGRELLAGHSLFGTVLSRLDMMLRDRSSSKRAVDSGSLVDGANQRRSRVDKGIELLRNLRDVHARRTTFSRDNLLKSMIPGADFAWSFNQLLDKEVEAPDMIRAFVKELLDGYEQSFLVVLVDDCDIYPELLPGLFDDLLLLGGSDRIITIMAYDPAVLRPMIGHRLLENEVDKIKFMIDIYPEFAESFRQQIRRYEFKMLPLGRNYLLPLFDRPDKRLRFRDQSGVAERTETGRKVLPPTLIQLLEKLPLPEEWLPVRDFRDLFDILFLFSGSDNNAFVHIPTDFSRILPDTPRGLARLYQGVKEALKLLGLDELSPEESTGIVYKQEWNKQYYWLLRMLFEGFEVMATTEERSRVAGRDLFNDDGCYILGNIKPAVPMQGVLLDRTSGSISVAQIDDGDLSLSAIMSFFLAEFSVRGFGPSGRSSNPSFKFYFPFDHGIASTKAYRIGEFDSYWKFLVYIAVWRRVDSDMSGDRDNYPNFVGHENLINMLVYGGVKNKLTKDYKHDEEFELFIDQVKNLGNPDKKDILGKLAEIDQTDPANIDLRYKTFCDLQKPNSSSSQAGGASKSASQPKTEKGDGKRPQNPKKPKPSS